MIVCFRLGVIEQVRKGALGDAAGIKVLKQGLGTRGRDARKKRGQHKEFQG